METITQLVLGIVSVLKPTISRGICKSPRLVSEVISFFVKPEPDICFKEESPTWKYLYKLTDYYETSVHTVLPYFSLAWDQFIFMKHYFAGLKEQLDTHYYLYSHILMNDQLFVFVFKMSSLLLFLFVMHWLKRTNTTTNNNEKDLQQTSIQLPSKSNSLAGTNTSDKSATPQTIICEYEFKTPNELRVEAETLKSVMLDKEEKRRRKRISKKRKCVSAGPILIHSIKQKKLKPLLVQPYAVAMLPPEDDRNHYLPLRSKPLIVGTEKSPPVIANKIAEDVDETDVIYMCVYKHKFIIIEYIFFYLENYRIVYKHCDMRNQFLRNAFK